VYAGSPIPPLNRHDHEAFFLLLQTAVLLSLKEKKLLTPTQCDQCVQRLGDPFRERPKDPHKAESPAL
jgi:hypothetical protein